MQQILWYAGIMYSSMMIAMVPTSDDNGAPANETHDHTISRRALSPEALRLARMTYLDCVDADCIHDAVERLSKKPHYACYSLVPWQHMNEFTQLSWPQQNTLLFLAHAKKLDWEMSDVDLGAFENFLDDRASVEAFVATLTEENRDRIMGKMLRVAAYKGYRQTVLLLRDLGVSIDSADSFGITALVRVIRFPEMVTFLLEHGASPHKTMYKGWTPLHHAAYYGEIDSAQRLINFGARADAMTKIKEVPFDLAKRGRNAAMMDLLHRTFVNQILGHQS